MQMSACRRRVRLCVYVYISLSGSRCACDTLLARGRGVVYNARVHMLVLRVCIRVVVARQKLFRGWTSYMSTCVRVSLCISRKKLMIILCFLTTRMQSCGYCGALDKSSSASGPYGLSNWSRYTAGVLRNSLFLRQQLRAIAGFSGFVDLSGNTEYVVMSGCGHRGGIRLPEFCIKLYD